MEEEICKLELELFDACPFGHRGHDYIHPVW